MEMVWSHEETARRPLLGEKRVADTTSLGGLGSSVKVLIVSILRYLGLCGISD